MEGVPDETQQEAAAWVERYSAAAQALGLEEAIAARRAAEEDLLDAAEALTQRQDNAEALDGFRAARSHVNLRYRRALVALAMRAPLTA